MTNTIEVPVKTLKHFEGLSLPFYATSYSAGMDILAAVDSDILLPVGQRILVPTGLSFAIPNGYEIQIRPRSGLAFKHGISLVNTPGTIDADYRGEVKILMINHGQEDFTITRGMRIAQAILAPITQIVWRKTENLEATHRSDGGFGSTGKI